MRSLRPRAIYGARSAIQLTPPSDGAAWWRASGHLNPYQALSRGGRIGLRVGVTFAKLGSNERMMASKTYVEEDCRCTLQVGPLGVALDANQ
jgi:hypothetical protein